MILRTLRIGCLLWLYVAVSAALAEQKLEPFTGADGQPQQAAADDTTGDMPKPMIPPGYKPIDRQTETGLWMELEDYERSVQQSALLIKDGPINDYVKKAACRVAGDYCADLRVYIIRNPGFNASMSANGVMLVWTGLLVRVSSEDELSAVLGHELAHYTQLHTLERLRRIKANLAASSVIDILIGMPLTQMVAVANIMSFNRDQEQEADLLGVHFMYESGYDPHAAASVWQTIVEEEANAVARSEQPNLFTQTHPLSADRIESINAFVERNYPDTAAAAPDSGGHVAMLNLYYPLLMEDQIDTNRFGRTENILKRHRQLGVDPAMIDFFYGEMYRQRNAEGDQQRAQQAYERSAASDNPAPEAFRNLGYIHLKRNQPHEASVDFRKYLELKPDADDRAMIEFYLEE